MAEEAEEAETAARFKARLDRWHAYNQRSRIAAETAPLAHPGIRHDDEVQQVAGAKMASPNGRPQATTTGIDPVTEQHIAELKAAVEHERARNEQLAQTVRREQALHFLAMNAEAQRKPAPPPRPVPAPPPEPWVESPYSTKAVRPSAAPFVFAILLIVGILAVLCFII